MLTTNNLSYHQQKIINLRDKKLQQTFTEKEKNKSSLKTEDILKNYGIANFNLISFKATTKPLQRALIQDLRIGNLQFVEQNGLRGETLSSKRHKRFLPKLKELGVTSIIDLRDKFTNENYGEMCEEVGLKYFHLPVDSFKLDTSKIIENMPILFEIMDKENYYMACALGLHRTDIAQTINYLFNPIKHEVPVMYGHQRAGVFKRDDIMRRIGSIKKEITQEQLKKLGWGEEFEQTYQARKEEYVRLNTKWAIEEHTKNLKKSTSAVEAN